MSTILGILGSIWGWFTFALFWGTLAALAVSAFFAFHPILLRLRVRASLAGQRGEFWAAHLFGLLRLGTIASRHSQYLVLEIGSYRRVLKRWGRGGADRQGRKSSSGRGGGPKDLPPFRPGPPPAKPASPPPHGEPEATFPPPSIDVRPAETRDGPTPSPAPPPSPEPGAGLPPAPPPTSQPPGPTIPPGKSDTPTDPLPTPPRPEPGAPSASAPSVSGTKVGEPTHPPSQPTSPPPRPPLSQPPAGGTPEGPQEESPQPGFIERFRLRLKEIRARLKKLYRTFRDKARLARRVWRRVSPIFWRFWANMTGTFAHRTTDGAMRVGLPDPHLTGVFIGMFFQAEGMFCPSSVRLKLNPVFSGSSLYCRTDTRLGIHPWKMLWACLAFLVDREVWRGAWDLWKWYRARPPAPPEAAT